MEAPNRTLRILIAEDHELSRNGIIVGLKKKSQMVVVGEAENGEEALKLVPEVKPDVVLMDIGMPIMDGIEATQHIKKRFPKIKVMMLTSHQEGEEVYASLAAGADAYCMKDIKIDRLIQVLEMVADGAVWFDPAIADMIMKALPLRFSEKNRHSGTSGRQRYNTDLTERELEVLQLLVEGKSNKDIAEMLNITIHTVKAHVCNVIQKLAVDDRTQAAVKALRDGLVKQA